MRGKWILRNYARQAWGRRHAHSSPYAFDIDTAVTTVSPGLYRGRLTNRWSIGDVPNGGYLMAMAVSAARKEISMRDPLSVSMHFVSKADEDTNADFRVSVLNSARSTETVSVSVSQAGKLRSHCLATFGNLKDQSGLTYMGGKAPELPPVDESVDAAAVIRKIAGDSLRIMSMIDLRVPADSAFAEGCLRNTTGRTALLEGWGRFEDGRSSWIPTIELTCHFRGRPQTGEDANPWCRLRFESRFIIDGLLEEDGEVWTADGTKLLCQSRQLARLWTPQGDPALV